MNNNNIINIFFDIECFTDPPCECYAITWLKEGEQAESIVGPQGLSIFIEYLLGQAALYRNFKIHIWGYNALRYDYLYIFKYFLSINYKACKLIGGETELKYFSYGNLIFYDLYAMIGKGASL